MIHRMKVRISKKLDSQLPALVVAKIRELGKQYQISQFGYETHPQGKTIYFGEGDRWHFVYGDRTMQVEMGAEHNVGASGVRWEIGATYAPPAGTTAICIYYVGDRYAMNVVNFSEEEKAYDRKTDLDGAILLDGSRPNVG